MSTVTKPIVLNETYIARMQEQNQALESIASALEEQANTPGYVHPSYAAKSNGLYKVTVDDKGHVSAATAVTKSDITSLGIPGANTTYNVATSIANGLMSSTDKSRLDGMAENANNYSHPTGDGNFHIPATGTTNNGKFLKAGATAGSAAWAALTKSDITALGIPGQDTVYTHPTHTAKGNGLYKVTVDASGHVSDATAVAKEDITALGIPSQDTVYTHPTYTAKGSGLYKIAVDASGHISGTTAVAKADITALGIPSSNTTYSAMSGATASAAGASGLVPTPGAGSQNKFLRGDASWQSITTGITLKRLWNNGNPQGAFAAQTITVSNLSQYTLFAIDFVPLASNYNNINNGGLHFFSMYGASTRSFSCAFGAWTENVATRKLTINKSNNTITFTDGASNGDGMNYHDNNICVPLSIYGIGGVTFS